MDYDRVSAYGQRTTLWKGIGMEHHFVTPSWHQGLNQRPTIPHPLFLTRSSALTTSCRGCETHRLHHSGCQMGAVGRTPLVAWNGPRGPFSYLHPPPLLTPLIRPKQTAGARPVTTAQRRWALLVAPGPGPRFRSLPRSPTPLPHPFVRFNRLLRCETSSQRRRS
jgi:hypothetical protein